MSSSPPAQSFTKRCNDFMVKYINEERNRGVIVGPETEQFVVPMIAELGRMLDSGRILDKGTGEQAIEDAVRSRDIPDRLEKFRLAHKNVFKGDEAEEPSGEITGPEYHKRMKAEAPGAFVRHDALDVRPEDLRLKHVDKQLPSGETIKVPLLQVLADDVREKCNLPATNEVDKLIRSYLTNHARSRADYQKQLEKSKPYREVKQWKECHKRPDRLEAQLRLELIEEALKKGGRKMKKQVHKFPVHELEELANWLRRIVNESASGAPPGAGAVVGDQITALGMMSPQAVSLRPPSPSAEEKRKRKSMG